MAGYYSIIQYMPDPSRCEGVNFGIMLLEKDTGMFRWILTRPTRRIQQVFPGVPSDILNDLITAFYNRLCAESISDLDGFTGFVLNRGGVVQCTEPVWVNFPTGHLEVTLHNLLEQLVL